MRPETDLRRSELLRALDKTRAKTLWLLEQVPDEFLRRRVHSFYSPIGWHFGHVGRTEEYWVMSRALGQSVFDEKLSFLYADLAENPKDNRVNIPGREGTIEYLRQTRERVLGALKTCEFEEDSPFLADGYAWEFALQHECQHQETITEMLQLIQKQLPVSPVELPAWRTDHETNMIDIPGGTFQMGSDDLRGYDNEKGAHEVHVDDIRLASHPVTAIEWTQFMEDGGYHRPELWTAEGWAWRIAEQANCPEYWVPQNGGWVYFAPLGARAIHPDEPAMCLSWFEADAYARWRGKRLPTEEEWEYAAAYAGSRREPSMVRRFPWGDTPPTCDHASHALDRWAPSPVGSHPLGATPLGLADMAGGVWEWTSSRFLPYPRFSAFPYDGYSKDHMLGAHRVCRGGSWATAGAILRCSFRNWYVPTYRQGLLGMRLAEL